MKSRVRISMIFLLSLLFCMNLCLGVSFAEWKPVEGSSSSGQTVQETIQQQQEAGPKQELTPEEAKQKSIDARSYKAGGQGSVTFGESQAGQGPKEQLSDEEKRKRSINARSEKASYDDVYKDLSILESDQTDLMGIYDVTGRLNCSEVQSLVNKREDLEKKLKDGGYETGGDEAPPAPSLTDEEQRGAGVTWEDMFPPYESEYPEEEKYRQQLADQAIGDRWKYLKRRFELGTMTLDEYMQLMMGIGGAEDYEYGKRQEKRWNIEYSSPAPGFLLAQRGFFTQDLTPDQLDDLEAVKPFRHDKKTLDQIKDMAQKSRERLGYPDPVSMGERTSPYIISVQKFKNDWESSDRDTAKADACYRQFYTIKFAYNELLRQVRAAKSEDEESISGNNSEDIFNSGVGVCRHLSAILVAALTAPGVDIDARIMGSDVPHHVWVRVRLCGQTFDLDPMNYDKFTPLPPREIKIKPKVDLGLPKPT